LVKVVEDAYGSFLSGFDTESDSEAASPDTPELNESHKLDENGEIIPMGAETWNLKPPTMTVQESREKSHALRENIENYESKYDEIQSIYVEYLMEDGKLESEEHAKFLEHFERNFLGEEVIQEPDLEEFLAYLKKREEDEQPRTESRMEKLMKMRTELELEIVRAYHPEADACEAVIVVRKYIGLTDVNGTYLLQTGFVNDRMHYRNDDSGSEIHWSTEWQYDLEGKKKRESNRIRGLGCAGPHTSCSHCFVGRCTESDHVQRELDFQKWNWRSCSEPTGRSRIRACVSAEIGRR